MTDPQRADEVDELETVPKAAPQTVRGKPRAEREATDELPWIDDQVSKVWVVLIVAVLSLILLYGILFGRAGMLNPVPSPSPSPSPTPVVTPSAPPSSSPTSSPSVPASPAASPSPGVSPSPSPGAAPSPARSPSPGASPAATPTSS